MGTSAGKWRGFAGFDPQACGDFLRARHPSKTAACVAAATGESARTVERWLAGQTPSLPAFWRLAGAYGPDFVAACVPGLAWVAQAAALASYEGMDREIARLRARQDSLARQLTGGGRR